MEITPDQPADSPAEEGTGVVEEVVSAAEEVVAAPKKATPKKKTVRKRKKATAKSKRSRKAAKPVVEPVLSMQEVGAELRKAKDEFKGAVAEPVMKALGRYSGMLRDSFYGAVGGFLGNKKRGD